MFRAAVIPVLALGAGLVSCSGSTESVDHVLGDGEISSLLSNLSEECGDRINSVRTGRDGGQEMATSLPSEVDFAPDIYTAIERAKAADKPILMTSVVTKGGKKKPGCDV